MVDYLYPQLSSLGYVQASASSSGQNYYFGSNTFTPRSISGLVLWLRSDLGITLNGSNVSSWADQSGNGNDVTQGSASQQPAYISNSINGYPSLRGDGVDDVLLNTGTVWPATAVTVLAVLKSFSGATTGEYFSCLQGGGDAALHFYGTSEVLIKRLSTGPTQTLTSATKSIITYTVTGTSGTEKMYLNGGSVSTVSGVSPAISNRALYIFAASAAGLFPRKYDLAELVIYNSVLSSTDQTQLENYAKARYSIA